ncbi:hypothetical protein V6N13_114620 [Hibiscus sabdariffa]|uniref:Uncharacterized protein n=1 Tax=Hibiscus sabdariffa TaxID=183260 RepID=A0ABR2U2Z6_9ROSI
MSGRRERRCWSRPLLGEWWRSGSGVLVRVAEKRRAAAGTRFCDEEETRVTAATRNRSGRVATALMEHDRPSTGTARNNSRVTKEMARHDQDPLLKLTPEQPPMICPPEMRKASVDRNVNAPFAVEATAYADEERCLLLNASIVVVSI